MLTSKIYKIMMQHAMNVVAEIPNFCVNYQEVCIMSMRYCAQWSAFCFGLVIVLVIIREWVCRDVLRPKFLVGVISYS